MKMPKLERMDHRRPNFKKLSEMREGLEGLIRADLKGEDFRRSGVPEALLRFQFTDGGFPLLDDYRIDADAAVDFCLEPTYICTALLMRALLEDESALGGREKDVLPGAMHMCCAVQLFGHGYDALRGQINALDYFIKGNVRQFLEKYPAMCPEFTEMMGEIRLQYAEMVEKGAFRGPWGEDYEESIRKINAYFEGSAF